MIDEREITWLAGLLEGEGYFAMRKEKTRRSYPFIAVSMTDRDIVERVASMFGTKVALLKQRQPHHKQQYRCVLHASGAVEWMRLIFPYMSERRKQRIREVLEEWESMNIDMTRSRIKRNPYVGFIDSAESN